MLQQKRSGANVPLCSLPVPRLVTSYQAALRWRLPFVLGITWCSCSCNWLRKTQGSSSATLGVLRTHPGTLQCPVGEAVSSHIHHLLQPLPRTTRGHQLDSTLTTPITPSTPNIHTCLPRPVRHFPQALSIILTCPQVPVVLPPEQPRLSNR